MNTNKTESAELPKVVQWLLMLLVVVIAIILSNWNAKSAISAIHDIDPTGVQPRSGLGQATGKLVCNNSEPLVGRRVYLLRVDHDIYVVIGHNETDANGRWFINNIDPNAGYLTYAGGGDLPKKFSTNKYTLFYVVKAGKITDFGEENYANCK